MKDFVHWFGVHWEIAWPILSAVLVTLMRSKTPEEWVALGERNPRWHGAINLVRALGVDPVKASRAVGQIVTGRLAASASPRALAALTVTSAPAPALAAVPPAAAIDATPAAGDATPGGGS